MASFSKLKNDGTTSSGNWLYCNSYTEKGNIDARRDNKNTSGIGLFSNWSWCWPVNRRIIYNRASVDQNGQPWDKEHPVIKWDPAAKDSKGGWLGDVPDGGWVPMSNKDKTKWPFIMKPECWFLSKSTGTFCQNLDPGSI